MTGIQMIDPAWQQEDPKEWPDMDTMTEYDTSATFNDVDAFGEIIRAHFPGLIDIASDGEVIQQGDDELMIFNGYGFRIMLSNGASFDIQIQQRDYADDGEVE